MPSSLIITVLIVIFAVIFDFINGFHDTATAVATSISTRALTPKTAIIICAIFNFIGAFTGTAVAKTVGDNIVSHTLTPQWVIMCADFIHSVESANLVFCNSKQFITCTNRCTCRRRHCIQQFIFCCKLV